MLSQVIELKQTLATFDAGIRRLGVGIIGMRERVKQLGGKFQIISGNPGTIVKVTLPREAEYARAQAFARR